MEGQQNSGRRVRGIGGIGLLEGRTLVGESTHPAITSKIVIEGTILLNEDDDVLDVSYFGAQGCSGVPSDKSCPFLT